MRQREHVWWVSATVMSLAGFSYFAGLGMRGLTYHLTGDRHASGLGPGYLKIASAAPRVPAEPDLRPADLYMDVLQKLRSWYVEPLPTNTHMARGAAEAMLSKLGDPNTRMLGRAEMDALRGASVGEYTGLGAVLTIRRYSGRKGAEAAPAEGEGRPNGVRTVTVVSVAPGGPADHAGMRPGDRISELDGHWIAPVHLPYSVLTSYIDPPGIQDGQPRDPDELIPNTQTPEERAKARQEFDKEAIRWKGATDLASALEQLYSAEAGEHELTIERGSPAKSMKLKLAFAPVKVPTLTHKKLEDGTGYLQIGAFNGMTARQATEALGELQAAGVKNLVVDLRGCPGGSLEAARDVAGLLLGDVKFAVLKERDAERKLVDRPLVLKGSAPRLKPAAVSVLVDGGTAGAAELLAAALRELAGAKLVGSTTFGDGTEQELVRLENGMGLSITRAKMLTSRGVDFDGKGLTADVAPQGDPVAAAVKALTARPAAARS